MSVVTNLIFKTPVFRQEESLSFIKKYRFVKVDDYAGGTKCMEVDLYLSAHNYLNESELIKDFLEFKEEGYQLFIQGQDDDYFTTYSSPLLMVVAHE